MVNAAVTSAIEKLSILLLREATYIWRVSDKIEELKDELVRIQCFLKDADAKQHGSETIRHSISEITTMAHAAEDILADYVQQVASTREGGVINTLKRCLCIFCELLTTHQVGSKIDKFKAKLSIIRESFAASGIQVEAATSSSQDRPPNHVLQHVVDTYLVGLEHKVDELVTNLVDIKCEAVSIWGMGGVGKTTIAKQTYKHKKVRDYFTYFAWGSISQRCQTKSQLEDILIELSSPDPNNRERIQGLKLPKLAEELSTYMTNNKCLVVVDDIWNVRDWNSLNGAFTYSSGSKILLTTRKKDVALAMHVDLQQRSVIHALNCLNDDQSWELFQKIVFPEETIAELEELGNKMVKHCKGLPLTITILAKLLARRKNKIEWEILYKDIESRPEGDDTSKVDNVLSLSYDHLPTELKQCFLYMGVFPEDCEISLEKLFCYWVAEGFVSSTTGNTAHYNCMIQMRKLIEMSMVLKGLSDDMSSEMITCRMHDRMRDLCISKGEEVKFLQVNNLASQRAKNDAFSLRLAVHSLEFKNRREEKQERNSALRSLVYVVTPGMFGTGVESFLGLLYLRVLDLENVRFEGGKLPEGIGKLIQLRYLSLRKCNVITLPSSLGNLTLLITLDLRVSQNWKLIIPDVIWKMKNLINLYLPILHLDSPKIDLKSLENLETLVNFEIGFMDVKDLLKTVKLRRLALYFSGKDNRIEKEYIIFNDTLKNIQYLAISNIRSSELADGFISQMVSACTNLDILRVYAAVMIKNNTKFSEKITAMYFSGTIFDQDPMLIFERLPKLKYLEMVRATREVRRLVWSKGGFPQLRTLYLKFLEPLDEWRVEEGAMPNLHHLRIMDCHHLKFLPDGLWFIKTLKELEILDMPKEFCDRLKEGGADFHKIKHIPSIRIRLKL